MRVLFDAAGAGADGKIAKALRPVTFMELDPLLQRICDELSSAHRAHTILLYGSRADGSAGPDSDYDVAAFGPVEKQVRDARLVDGAFLDIFVYPESVLTSPGEAQLALRGSKILVQRGTEAEGFLARLEEMFARGPARLPADEIEAIKVWALKMIVRIRRGDVEGNYRRVWLLTALLEDYFHIRGSWYQGPKKSLRWLEQLDPPAYRAFSAALAPGATDEEIYSLVKLVSGKELP